MFHRRRAPAQVERGKILLKGGAGLGLERLDRSCHLSQGRNRRALVGGRPERGQAALHRAELPRKIGQHPDRGEEQVGVLVLGDQLGQGPRDRAENHLETAEPFGAAIGREARGGRQGSVQRGEQTRVGRLIRARNRGRARIRRSGGSRPGLRRLGWQLLHEHLERIDQPIELGDLLT